MKIAVLGSAPSSLGLAPLGDPAWRVWGCSPGVFYQCGSPQGWFELHRWEPPVIGVAEKQRQWFSPEYVAWMALRDPERCPVWMYEAVPEIKASRALPIEDLTEKFGTFFFTSSISIMIAMAIREILKERETRQEPTEDAIGLYGIDMTAHEEYGYQRAGCQHFLLLAADLGIKVVVPAESDLLRPMPIYGLCESTHWHVKSIARKAELQQRLAHAEAQAAASKDQAQFLRGALDDLEYHLLTWGEDRVGMGVHPTIMARGPNIRRAVLESLTPVADTANVVPITRSETP